MTEFFTVLTPANALAKMRRHVTHAMPSTIIPTVKALNRVTTTPVRSPANLPSFPRSTMDGYAVQAASTFGASANLPAYLKVIGEVPMGGTPNLIVKKGQAALIHTGGMIPAGADAVIMIENTQPSHAGEIEVLRAVAVGENTLKVGEDVRMGAEIVPAGTRLRPQDLGGLLALGITEVDVVEQPRVALLATGDEVVPPETNTAPGQVRDINSYTIFGLVERTGSVPQRYGIIPDNYKALQAAARRALNECDALVISAGSSVSTRDMTFDVLNSLDDDGPGVLVHGVAVKPGKPTLMAVAAGKPVIGLPGNPVSAMVVADLFLVPILYHLQGQTTPDPRVQRARLIHNLYSETGREDYVPARLIRQAGELWAEPIFGKSNLIFTLVRADGAIMIPLNANGLNTGDLVNVRLF